MDRVQLKNKAKELIRGNKWYLWKPVIIIGLVIGVIEGIAFGLDSALGTTYTQTIELFGQTSTYNYGGYISSIVGIFTTIASSALAVAYAYYVLSFVRGSKLEVKDVLDFMKKHWVVSILVTLLVGLIIIGCSIALIIPGIIASIGLMFYKEVCADNPEMKPMEIVKKSWAITKGHKMELFIMGLSFIGWEIVAGFTFGILFIWLVPYMTVTFTLAYEELKK